MNYIVRRAEMKDCSALYRLSLEGLGYDYPEERLRARVEKVLSSEKDAVFVAESGGEVVGFIHAADYDVIYADSFKNIMGIAVFEEYRRCGIGSALLRAAEEWAAATGAEGIRLNSGETRTGAHSFYRSQGYESHKKQLNFIKYFN